MFKEGVRRSTMMRTLAVDESLSEETRESAQKALDELVLARIEREKETQAERSKLNNGSTVHR